MGQQRRIYMAFAALTLAMMMVITLQGCSSSRGAQVPKPSVTSTQTGRACASHQHCADGKYCTTEDGACNRGPDCDAGKPCAMVCYGVCAPRRTASTGCGGPGVMCMAEPTPCEGALCAVGTVR
jgi:hypothetical protein